MVEIMEDQEDGMTFETQVESRTTDQSFEDATTKNEDQRNVESSSDESKANSMANGRSGIIDIPKHPLQYNWVLWYCKPERHMPWEECMKEVFTFNTVEDFWAMYNHIQPASGLPAGSDYYMFKKGIQPMWEDPHNCEGGRWLVTVERNRRDLLDHFWLELLIAIVGEQFDDYGEFVSGAVVNIRQKGDKVSLWTKDASREDVNRRIGQILKQKLDIAELITYELHQDTKLKNSSMVKAQLRI